MALRMVDGVGAVPLPADQSPFGSAADRHGEVLRRWRLERRDGRAQRAVPTRRHARRAAHSDDELLALAREAHDAGWRIATHAIGDTAIDQVLRVYETLRRRADASPHRALRPADRRSAGARRAGRRHRRAADHLRPGPGRELPPVPARRAAGARVSRARDARRRRDGGALVGCAGRGERLAAARDAGGAAPPRRRRRADRARPRPSRSTKLSTPTPGAAPSRPETTGIAAACSRACRRISPWCRATCAPRRPRRSPRCV